MKWVLFILGGVIIIALASFRYSVYSEEQQFKQGITYEGLLFVAGGCDGYKNHYGEWPHSLEQLHTFNTDFNNPWTQDAWGRDFIIVPFNSSLGYGDVVSYGRDGRQGGVGLDKDLSVRFPIVANKIWNEEQGIGLKFPGREIDTNWFEENSDIITNHYNK
jgi:hypothetical protein